MMNTPYRETINWLFSLKKFGIKLGLSNVSRLLELLGNPHHELRCIHIAGTNGKGSTAAFLHAIYSRAGYRPGLYTSPHLIDFTERIVIGDAPITPGTVTALVKRLRSLCRSNNLEHITFFEFVTALALTYFAQKKADPIILETGMGGRLDATNVVDPLVTIITSISREHTAYLGSTLMQITPEKAGIIKQGRPCISAVTRPGPRNCIRQACHDKEAQLLEYGRDFSIRQLSNGYSYRSHKLTLKGLQPALAGLHQARNAALAVTAATLLQLEGYALQDTSVHDGLKSCFWPGRFESVRYKNRHIVLDGAHNPAAWMALIRTLKNKCSKGKLILIIGIMRDKDMISLQRLVSQAHTCIFFKPCMDRSAGREYLEKYIVFSEQKRVFWCETIAQSLKLAHNKSELRDFICVTGSLFAVGEARELLNNHRKTSSGRIAL